MPGEPGPAGPGLPVAWGAPPEVGAFMSTREGGLSGGPWTGWNLGDRVGDDPSIVAVHRERFAQALGARPVWLRQVHGCVVVEAVRAGPQEPVGDGAWTDQPGVACTVQVADCLPVLMAAGNGRAVGAAHAGWRGLAAGVLEATLQALTRAAGCPASQVHAWLGPCIGPQHFEVGADVFEAFGGGPAFVPRSHPDGRPRWLADLPALARARLAAHGVVDIAGGRWCTVSDPGRFYSYRRDGVTGRMAAAVWLR